MTADWAWRTAQPSGRPIATTRPGLGWVFSCSPLLWQGLCLHLLALLASRTMRRHSLARTRRARSTLREKKKSWAGFCFVCCCLWDPPALIWQRLRDSEVPKKLSFRKRWLAQRSACFGGGGGAARESERRVGVWRVRGLLGRRDQEKKGLGSGDTERSTATPSGGRDFAER